MCVCVHSGILLRIKNEIMPFAATWVDLEIIRQKHITYMWNLKYGTNELKEEK